jgi:hypothetical protein
MYLLYVDGVLIADSAALRLTLDDLLAIARNLKMAGVRAQVYTNYSGTRDLIYDGRPVE